jgi:hypothetical protein
MKMSPPGSGRNGLVGAKMNAQLGNGLFGMSFEIAT